MRFAFCHVWCTSKIHILAPVRFWNPWPGETLRQSPVRAKVAWNCEPGPDAGLGELAAWILAGRRGAPHRGISNTDRDVRYPNPSKIKTGSPGSTSCYGDRGASRCAAP